MKKMENSRIADNKNNLSGIGNKKDDDDDDEYSNGSFE